MNPYEEYNQATETNPYDNLPLATDGNQKALKRIDKVAQGLAYGDNPQDVMTKVDTSTIEQLNMEEQEQDFRETMEVNKALVERTATEQPENTTMAVTKYKDDYQQLLTNQDSVLATEIAAIRNTPGSEGLTDKEIVDIAIQDKTKNALAKSMDEQGGIETGLDFLNMMVIPDESWNWSELSGESWLGSAQGMEALGKHRSSLSPSDRIKFDEMIVEQLQGLEDSTVQQYTTVLALYGEDPVAAGVQAAEKVELASVFYQAGAKLTRGFRTLNKMKQLAKVGDTQTASIAAEIAGGSKEAAKGTGIPQVDAAMAGNPLKEGIKDVLNGTTDTKSSIHRAHTTELGTILKEVDEITGLRPDLTPHEQRKIAEDFKEAFGTDVGSVRVEVSENQEITLVSELDDSFRFKAEYRIDQLGGFQEKESGMLKTGIRHVLSPKAIFGKDKSDLVEAPVLGEMRSSKAAKLYQDAVLEAVKPIKGNKESLNNVNAMLLKLDGQDIDTSRKALISDGVGGLRLTAPEYEAWRNVREVFDHAHKINNRTLRREMTLRDIRHVTLGTDEYYVKNFDILENAKARVRAEGQGSFRAVVKDEDGIFVPKDMKAEELDDLYKKGYKVVEIEGDDAYGWFRTTGDDHTKYAIMKNDDVKHLPQQVLNKVPNYVPKERAGANYFIKKQVNLKANGQPRKVWTTRAFSGTETQAKTWLAKVAKAEGKEHKADDWAIVFDRENPSDTSFDSNTVRTNGGMYRGSRSSRQIKDVTDDTAGARMDAFGALQRHLNYTADKMAMSEMRMVLKKRWMNDASDVDVNVASLNWKEARGAIEESNASAGVKSRLLAQHDQISHISRIPTKSEQVWQGTIRAIATHFDRKGKEDIAKYLYSDDSVLAQSPVARLKAGSFNLLLGAFNPSQFVVQFMGATVAAGANPVAFTKAVPKMMATSIIDASNATTSEARAMIKTLIKKKLVPEEFLDEWEMWNRTGYRESVLRANGDLDGAGNYAPLDQGAVRRGFSALMDKSTAPYQMGELANMRVSFYTALEMDKQRVGKGWKNSDAALRRVVSRSEDYRLNMSNANKATYQKGLMSLPTQFKSIYTKFAEGLFGDGFTKTEKARIITMQIAAFGAAGIPIVNHFADEIANMVTDENSTDAERQAARRGAVGWLLNDYLDVDAAVSGRVAVAGDMITEVTNLWSSDVPALKAALGASFTTGDRVFDFFNNILLAGRITWEADDLDAATVAGVATILGQAAAQLPTSSRRAMETYYLNEYNQMRVGDRTLWQYAEGEVGMEDVIARALGFSSQELEDVYATSKDLRDRKQATKDKATMYINLLDKLMVAIEDGDEGAVRMHHLAMRVVMGDITNGKDLADIQQAIQSQLQQRDFRGYTFQQWVQNYNSDLLGAAGQLFLPGQAKLDEVMK